MRKLGFLMFLGLSACGSGGAEQPQDKSTPKPDQLQADVSNRLPRADVDYACDNGWKISVLYNVKRPDGQEGANVSINGKLYEMYQAKSASGARYTTEQGLKKDFLLEWFSKGEEAMLSESPLDDSVEVDSTTLITKCQAPSR